MRARTNRSVMLLVAATVLLTAVSALGCGGKATTPESAGASGEGAAESAEGELPLAADFTLQDVEGNAYTLSESNGKVRLIDFWATWCAPCREEVPMLNELHRTYGPQGLEIVAISDFEESPELVRNFVEEHEVEYLNLLGAEEMGDKYIVMGLPMAYLVDREGRVVESYFGPKPTKALEEKIRELLG